MRAVPQKGRCAVLALLVAGVVSTASWANGTQSRTVEQWGIFELSLQGSSEGNPFAEVQLKAEFRRGDQVVAPEGFYVSDSVHAR
jgi:hypothetical protein